VILTPNRSFASTARTQVIDGLTNGNQYRFRVRAVNEFGPPLPLAQGWSPLSAAVTPATVPNPPVIGTAAPGPAGGAITASVTFTAPSFNGGQAITSYTVRAWRVIAADGTVATTPTTSVIVTTGLANNPISSGQIALAAGSTYRFDVVATNGTAAPLGTSAPSALSNAVAPA
jgi:hypothetical protein